eukprot:SAG22_NODE_3104_length_1938_cov_1.974986_2_plen_43_part_00
MYDAAGDHWVQMTKGEARRYHPLVLHCALDPISGEAEGGAWQ